MANPAGWEKMKVKPDMIQGSAGCQTPWRGWEGAAWTTHAVTLPRVELAPVAAVRALSVTFLLFPQGEAR